MKVEKTVKHPLENNAEARAYFDGVNARSSKGHAAVWRGAVEACTGGLPTWAARARAGRKPGSQVLTSEQAKALAAKAVAARAARKVAA